MSDPNPGYQPAPPPPYGASPLVGRPADLGLRFVARLIDMAVIWVVDMVLTAIIVVGAMSASGGFAGFSTAGAWAARAVSALISAGIALGYFTFMESRTGKTLGKMILKLETRGPGGGRPTVEEALKRNLWVAIPVLGVVPFLGWVSGPLELAAVIAIMVTISSSPTKQGWHDRFADTQVVRTG